MTQLKCPACGATDDNFFGLPYGLRIGSCDEDKCVDVHPTILIKCDECGAVLGGYKYEEDKTE